MNKDCQSLLYATTTTTTNKTTLVSWHKREISEKPIRMNCTFERQQIYKLVKETSCVAYECRKDRVCFRFVPDFFGGTFRAVFARMEIIKGMMILRHSLGCNASKYFRILFS